MQPEPSCWHKRIGDDGICLDCGKRTAIQLELVTDEPDHVPAIERICDDIATRMQEMARKLAAQRMIITDLLRNVGDSGACKGCQAEIYWMIHHNGKRAPYNLDGTNHFSSCPDKELFRRKRNA